MNQTCIDIFFSEIDLMVSILKIFEIESITSHVKPDIVRIKQVSTVTLVSPVIKGKTKK